jgi:1-acyl-sn-glycerol-3-phosphate acyltransferase
MSENLPQKFVDIEKIFREKAPNLYPKVPRFVFNYLKRIVHEDDVNALQLRQGHKFGLEYFAACQEELGLNVTFEGLENVPEKGGAIVAACHPMAGVDGVAMVNILATKRKDVHIPVNDIVSKLKNFGDVLIGIDKIGSTGFASLRKLITLYRSERMVAIFPAGLVSRRKNGKIKDLAWQKGFLSMAVRNNKPIIPVFVEGHMSDFFYNLSNFRTAIGIKANLEMLYLADEMFRQKGRKVHIVFGKPIDSSIFSKKNKNHTHQSQFVRDYLYELKYDRNLTFENYLIKNQLTHSFNNPT